ncbi:MAG: hypothetical protein P8X95_21770, partial [Anaerolineales bacterium]
GTTTEYFGYDVLGSVRQMLGGSGACSLRRYSTRTEIRMAAQVGIHPSWLEKLCVKVEYPGYFTPPSPVPTPPPPTPPGGIPVPPDG